MVDLTLKQKDILKAEGHLLITGGPGSGKTTVSIIKAAEIADKKLKPGQKILFLSFARATVSRVLEAIDEEQAISRDAKRRLEVDTYHSFFWQIIKTHGYLMGFPRRLSLLTPPNEGIALASIRRGFKAANKLNAAEKKQKEEAEYAERLRLAKEEGRVCFDLFASTVGALLHASEKVRKLISNAHPYIILDEFQDTNADQWHVVKALGQFSSLLALADPEQRIFEFIGADPERLNHLRAEFTLKEFDLEGDNHRSKGTEIALFGNDVLKGKFSKKEYTGIAFSMFESNSNQAFSSLLGQTLQARQRLIKSGKKGWSLAILVPTKKMTRQVSDSFHQPFGAIPPISHRAAVDMESAILGAEVVALLLQPHHNDAHLPAFIEGLCNYFRGCDGDTPTKGGMEMADGIKKAFGKCMEAKAQGKKFPKKSIYIAIHAVYEQIRSLRLIGDPDADWREVRLSLANGECPRLKEIAEEVKNVRLLDRGTQLRQSLSQDWRQNGAYVNALDIVQRAFVQEHFSTAQKPEKGVIVMNMHKAKGKQFDEVIIFEGWPRRVKGQGIVANPDRIIWDNVKTENLSQARQNFRVSITRAKQRTTILTPKDDPCVLLISGK